MLRSIPRLTATIGERTEDLICWTGGVAGSLLFAFSPVQWSQAVITEAYALNAFFLVAVCFLTYTWMRSPREPLPYMTLLLVGLGAVSLVVSVGLLFWQVSVYADFWQTGVYYVLGMAVLCALVAAVVHAYRKNPDHRLLYVTALTFGIGLTNYQVLLLLLASLVVVIFLKDLKLFRDFLIVGGPFILVYLLAKKGFLPPISHPTGAACITYITLNVVALVLAYFYVPNGKAVAPTILCMELGLAIYGFMTLASETNPPMNWAYPRTWQGFIHAISRGQYEKIVPTDIFSMVFVQQLGDYLRDLRGTFTLPVAVLGFIPFTAWYVRFRGRVWRALYLSVGVGILAVALILTEEVIAPQMGEIPAITNTYRALIAIILFLMVIGGLITFAWEIRDFFWRLFGIERNEHEVRDQSIVGMDIDTISRKWTVVTVSGFLVMSLVLVMLASPKGDIQDLFIQRVKFISSHALYAFWIGYGYILGMALVDAVVKGNVLIKGAGLALGMGLVLIPLYENGYNKELIRISGGAEQNGHDFGWQFGNYQLRGAAAIQEELAKDEEPLPNPDFPTDMTTNAIFYGGTDPGRFVPTYMIYSAQVREDVYLITQNALADNTYMNVMRDLYGDRIWIPAQSDSTKAFQRYVDEVNSGKRPRNAQLTIEDGRVQVSGVLGVMEINGILAQMIFEHNNFRHDFYVEESYVIGWMYPYLTPHGLIMKLNQHQTPLTPVMVRNDRDFWDWYTRRLVDSEKFRRDVVARKSFSKLRSAIAGLYANRGRYADAEQGFQEARILYPLSPEANFRLAQEVMMPQQRFGECRKLIEAFFVLDPGNTKSLEFVDQVRKIEDLDVRIRQLEAERQKDGKMDISKAFELADLYRQAHQTQLFVAIISGILETPGLPPEYLFQAATLLRRANVVEEMNKALKRCMESLPPNTPPDRLLDIARLYGETKQYAKMGEVMQVYLTRQPNDWRGWLDMATVQISQNRKTEALQCLERAVRFGGNEAVRTIMKDPRLGPLYQPQTSSTRDLMGIPGIMP
jgi:tetratricopeptide (TPR) repeat protein